MSAFTPGPWCWINSETDLPRKEGEWRSSLRTVKEYRRSSLGIPLPFFILETDEICGENMEANARLISAAPDLFEALTIIRDLDDEWSETEGTTLLSAQTRAKIDAAIAKATTP